MKKTTLKVIKDRVLIEIEALGTVSAGGIILPENRKERDQIGVAVAVGPDVREIHADDRVLYNDYSQLLEHEGKKYRIVKEENVLAVLEKDLDIRVGKKGMDGKVNWEDLD